MRCFMKYCWVGLFHEILLGRLQVFTKTGRRQLEDCPEASLQLPHDILLIFVQD